MTKNLLPKMVELSNNSRITQSVSKTIETKFTQQEKNEFMVWLSLIGQARQQKLNNTIHDFMSGKIRR
jgi:hypothetical protein